MHSPLKLSNFVLLCITKTRPLLSNRRTMRVGDFELDTIIGKDGKGAIVTLVDRKTNYMMMKKSRKGKEAEEVVPLGFVIADDYRTDSITLYFGLNSTWQTECYLCDNQTSMRRRIYNDSRIRIATPKNHEVRYYIQGPYKEPSDPDNLPMHRSLR